ncbi:MAG: hypothetical protein ABI197_07480 [Granulicella sp.]
MRNLIQPVGKLQQQPCKLRWIALLSVLLIAVMSTVQVCHSHDLVTQAAGSRQHLPASGADHCPLCVAMHSARPATPQTAPEPVLLIQVVDSASADARQAFRWHFQRAIRPPPGDGLRS